MRNRIFLVCMLVAMFFTAGCEQTDAIYESVKSFEATDAELQMLIDGNLGVEVDGISVDEVSIEDGVGSYFKELGYNFFKFLSIGTKQYCVYVIGISWLIGFIIIRLSPNAIKVRRIGWFVFIFGIPVLTLVLLFGSAFAADALM